MTTTKPSVEEMNIAICEFMGVKFYPYKDNHSYIDPFNTYSDCLQWIEKNKMEGYKPEISWQGGAGKYH